MAGTLLKPQQGTSGVPRGPERDAARRRTQTEMIRQVMLSAAECGTWLSLREIAALTRYGEASISAQLRHLRKVQFGRYVLDKRRRGERGIWEYRLLPPHALAPASEVVRLNEPD